MKWCVYMHLYDGVPFYVGMGTRPRAISESRRSDKWAAFVNSIPHYDVRVVLRTMSHRDAAVEEVRLIRLHWDTLVNERVPEIYPEYPSIEEHRFCHMLGVVLESYGWTQAQLAHRLRVSPTRINVLRHGTIKRPRGELAGQLIALYDARPRDRAA